MVKCNSCGAETDELAVFPGGVCLACWRQTDEGQRMPTADELVAMWGGKARKPKREKRGARR